MKFSIVTVCLNPGDKLNITLASVLSQTYGDWEVILKDGGSKDGATTAWMEQNKQTPGYEKVRLFTEPDRGIYDAMNQAVSHAEGDFLIFLNCGDRFADDTVLEAVAAAMEGKDAQNLQNMVFYGDTLSEKTNVVIASTPKITGFSCYRNIPCHQSCFYSRALCTGKPYDLQYKIRADYDHFLWCFYEVHANFVYVGFPVSSYEGGGYSESRANRDRDRQEYKQITSTYMSRARLLWYQTLLACTLAPLRKVLAESKVFSGGYHWLKSKLYGKKN